MNKSKIALILLNILAAILIYIIFVPTDYNRANKEEGEITLKVSYTAVTGPTIYVEKGQDELKEASKEYGNLDCSYICTKGDIPYNHVFDPASIGKCVLMGKVIGKGEENHPIFQVTHYKLNIYNQYDYILLSIFAVLFLFVIAIVDLYSLINFYLRKSKVSK